MVTTALGWQRSRVVPHALGLRELNRSPQVSYTQKGKFACTFQGTALFQVKLLKSKDGGGGRREERGGGGGGTGKGSQCDGRASNPPKPGVFCLLVSSLGISHSCGSLTFSVHFVPSLSEWDWNSLLSEDGQRAKRKCSLDNNNTHSYSFCRIWTSLFWEHIEGKWV